MRTHVCYYLLLTICLSATATPAADWSQFRGPGGLGISDEKGLPETWSAGDNIDWRVDLPGLGTSSPIVLADRIYLTCYSGYGADPADPGDINDLMRHVVCLARESGEELWTKSFAPSLPESSYSGGNNARHGYSSSTLASDGERLYVFLGKSGVYCLDLAGNQLWHTRVGDKTKGWGSSNSPLLYRNLVIINASVESGALIALDIPTGEIVWRTEGMRSSWNTPALVEVAGRTELVVSVQGWLLSFDPATGEELWRCEGITTYVCPSVVAHDGVIYATGGRGIQYTLAVRGGGRGDVTDSHLLWRIAKGSNVSSPVYHAGHLYLASDSRGIAFCIDAANGEIIYQERLRPSPGRIYSSPVVADGKVYYVSQHAGVFVVAAKPEFELLAHNEFQDDDHRANARPVIHNGQLLLRNDGYLYCIGRKSN